MSVLNTGGTIAGYHTGINVNLYVLLAQLK